MQSGATTDMAEMIDAKQTPSPEAVAADLKHQARIGLALAAAIIGAWLVVHIYSIFFFEWSWASAAAGIALMLLQTWLYVGLFIVAHDCMHGSLVPLRPAWNRAVGQLCLLLYAGFSFDHMNRKHHLHHRHAGTGNDPDFHDQTPHAFWPWYFKFFWEYFSGREVVVIALAVWAYILLLGAPITNIMTFLTVPAIVSSIQLFTFGTYLPHKPGDPAFADRHRSRSNDYPWLVSLLTCFHFGYHHEHHDVPSAPWWRLPKVHAEADRSAGLQT